MTPGEERGERNGAGAQSRRRQHAMAGDEDRDRIGAAGGADGARNSAGGLGEVAVGFCAATGDRQHLAPYSAVELGAARLQRKIEAVAVVVEVLLPLRGGLLQTSADRNSVM